MSDAPAIVDVDGAPITAKRELMPSDLILRFLVAYNERRRFGGPKVTNDVRDACIAALILQVEALARRFLADHPELIEQARAHAEAALDGSAGAETEREPVASDDPPAVAPST